jgi:hypothetical protein
MRRLRAVGEFAYDFVIGDDWRLAIGVVAALGGAALLVAIGVNAWWFTPVVVVAILGRSVSRDGGPPAP